MNAAAPFSPVASLRIADWAEARSLVMPLRLEVFVDEQGVPPDIEQDEYDPVSRHAIAADAGGAVIGTGRLLPAVTSGRMGGRRARARIAASAAAPRGVRLPRLRRRGCSRAVLHRRHRRSSTRATVRSGGVFMEAHHPHHHGAPLDPPA
jgi:hypothetical protein